MDHNSSLQLTGLSYLDWEAGADLVDKAARQCERTRLLDRQNLEQAAKIDSDIEDELRVIADVRSLGDAETAAQLRPIREKLLTMRRQVRKAKRQMLSAVGFSGAASPRGQDGSGS